MSEGIEDLLFEESVGAYDSVAHSCLSIGTLTIVCFIALALDFGVECTGVECRETVLVERG